MKLIYKHIILILLIFMSTALLAQLDKNKGTEKKGKIKSILLNNTKKVNKPKSLDLDGTNGFKKAYDKEKEKLKKKTEADKLKNKGILSQAKISEERFLKSFKKINGQYIYPKIDQNLGSFRSNSKSVNIICRDFQYPDGDRVSIFVNDVQVVYNVTLESNYKRFNIPLEVGLNKIVIKALNQGTSGPNTAAFKVFNDKGVLISSNEWNLATGAKATLLIAKDH